MNRCCKPTSRSRRNRSGMVLFSVVCMLGVLAALGLIVFTVTRIDFEISRNHILSTRALEQAESGVQFVKNRIEAELVSGKTLEEVAQSFNVSAPSGFTFDPVTQLNRLADTNLYSFTVTGRSDKAAVTIEATIRQAQAMKVGIFGNAGVELKPKVETYSFNSESVLNPIASDSTGEAVVGSNEMLDIGSNVIIDGYLAVGEDESGTTGSYPSGWDTLEVGRIDPDPLGLLSGPLAAVLSMVRTNNDNSTVSAIVNNQLSMAHGSEYTINSGNYYLTYADSGNNQCTLNIDSSGGPVNIFLEGGFFAGPKTVINYSGAPGDLRIFSNSTQIIDIHPNSTAKFFIYAPNAFVKIYPNGVMSGAIWANSILVQPQGDVYIDTSLLDKIKMNRIVIASWKEVRG